VGPDADGRFPAESVERLEAIAAWMDVNNTSIHGTMASPFPSVPWGRCTRRTLSDGSTRLYLHVFEWPQDGRLVLDGLLNQPRSAYLLRDGKGLDFLAKAAVGARIEIRVPVKAPDPIDTVVVLDVEGAPDVALPPTITADAPIFVGGTRLQVASSQRAVDVRYTLDGSEPSSASPIGAGPVRLTETATVVARAFRGVDPVSPAARATFTKVAPRQAVAVTSAPGVSYECVEGEFVRLPDFDRVQPAASGVVPAFTIEPRTRAHLFALRFRGFVRVPADGVYRFYSRSDDGSRLWIGETLVVENDGLHGAREESGVIALAAGLHPITVAMFEQSGDVELTVSYAGRGFPSKRSGPLRSVTSDRGCPRSSSPDGRVSVDGVLGLRCEDGVAQQLGRPLQLRNLAEPVLLHESAHAVDQRRVRARASRFLERAVQVVRECTVIVAVDGGVSRDLVGSTRRDEDGAALHGARAEPSRRAGAESARVGLGRLDEAGLARTLPNRCVSQARARVAAVEEYRQVRAGRQVPDDRVEVIVGERIPPVQVVRADDLVQVVVQFVAVPVLDLRSVAGVVEEQHVPGRSPVHEPVELAHDALRGGIRVGERDDVVVAEAQPGLDEGANLIDVVQAASQRVDRVGIAVQTDQERLLRHSPSIEQATGTAGRAHVADVPASSAAEKLVG
jgi:hypothetical protein